MNERIRQLAKEAGYDVKPFYKGEDGYQTPHYKDEKLEKYAELIVRECCQKLEDDGMVEVAIEMKQHFGVEE